MSGNRNFIIAIALSLAVLAGWQYFIAGPQLELQRKRAEAEMAQKAAQAPVPGVATTPGQPGTLPIGGNTISPNGKPVDRPTALAQSARVKIETPSVAGSINLTGGRLDDVSLKNYRETIDKNSPRIVLLDPPQTAEPYFADFGWYTDPANPVSIPRAGSVWTQQDTGDLTPTHPVTLTFANGEGWTFRRTFTVDDKYVFTIVDEAVNASGKPGIVKPYSGINRFGTPQVSGNWLVHEGPIGVLGEGLKEQKFVYKDIKGHEEDVAKTVGGWMGFVDKYWATALIPDKTRSMQPIFAGMSENGVDVYRTYMVGEPVTVADGGSTNMSTRLFAGAKEVLTINGYRDALGIEKFDLMIDWGWFWFITKPMFLLIDYLYKLIGNFGLAILLTTVLLKILFFPLANRSYESMSKMKKLQPEMKEIQTRLADDKSKQQQAMMELYKREKINPVAGCLPVLLQIPVFFSLYKVLFITIEMRQAPFYGWIHDLAAPDPTSLFNLFGLLPFTPPQALMIGVWPLIMGVTMFVQMKLNPAPPDPTQKIMFDWMPLIFTFTLSSFPAGLVIYWAWNNSLSIAQQTIIMKKNGVKIELWDNIKSMFDFLKRQKT